MEKSSVGIILCVCSLVEREVKLVWNDMKLVNLAETLAIASRGHHHFLCSNVPILLWQVKAKTFLLVVIFFL